MPIVQRDVFKCARCGHEWLPRSNETPTRCAKCKSPYWNKPKQKLSEDTGRVSVTKIHMPEKGLVFDREKGLVLETVPDNEYPRVADSKVHTRTKEKTKEIKRTA